MMPQFPELMHCAVPRDRSGQSDTGATAEMPIIYDVIQLASGTPWVTDGSTFNVVTQSEMTLIEPVNVTDVDGDGFISLGDTFNGSAITDIGKFGGQITYDFGASTINRSAHFVTTSDGFTYLLQPDGITLEGITDFNVVAESGGKATQIGFGNLTADDSVTVACYAKGTRIATPSGHRPIESIAVGDLVQTQTRDAQPVRFVWHSSHCFPGAADRHKPVLIMAGSLGANRPTRDLVVSPQHRVVVDIPLHNRDVARVFVPAKALTELRGVRLKRGVKRIEYYHLLLDHHDVLFAEGIESESLYPGPTLRDDMDSATQAEIMGVLQSHGKTVATMGFPALPVLTTCEAKRILRRLTEWSIPHGQQDTVLERDSVSA